MESFIENNLSLDVQKPFSNPSQNYVFELGRALFKSGNFKGSISYLLQARAAFIDERNFFSYMDCYNMLVCAFSELGEEELLIKTEREFEDNCKKYGIRKTPRVLMVNSFCFGIQKRNDPKASVYLKEALGAALANQKESMERQDSVEELKSKLDIMYCFYVFCAYYFHKMNYEKCAEELKRSKDLLKYFFKLTEELRVKKSQTDNVQLQQHFQSLLDIIDKEYLHIIRLDLNLKTIEALIEKDCKKAIQILWESYEKANAFNEKYLIPYIFLYMAFNHHTLLETDQAELFLNLSKKSAKAQSFKMLLRHIERLEKEFFSKQAHNAGNYDIVFNKEEHSFIGKQKGCVQFKNQLILLDLLNLFIENQGKSHSKKDLVKRLWKEEYSPAVHDNKIYVTVKRLRDSIEPNDGKSRYICRNREGYYLSDKVKVLVKQ